MFVREPEPESNCMYVAMLKEAIHLKSHEAIDIFRPKGGRGVNPIPQLLRVFCAVSHHIFLDDLDEYSTKGQNLPLKSYQLTPK